MKKLFIILIGSVAIAGGAQAQLGSGPGKNSSVRATDTIFGTLFLKDTIKGAPVWLSVQTLLGTATNNNAAVGVIGEWMAHSTVSASAVSLSTGTTATLDSLILTAGDWDVSGVIDYTFAATTSYTNVTGGPSTTRSALGSQDQSFSFSTAANVPTAAKVPSWVIPMMRISIASTTTVYLVTQATFSVSTLKAYGTIQARRAR